MRSFIQRFVSDDRGQSTTEYILILSVVVMVALKFRSMFQGTLTELINSLSSSLKQTVGEATTINT